MNDKKQNRRGLPGSKFLSFASPNERNQRKGDPGLPPLRGTLDQSRTSGAAQLARSAARPRAQTVLAQPHRSFVADRGGAQGIESQNHKPKTSKAGIARLAQLKNVADMAGSRDASIIVAIQKYCDADPFGS